MVIAVALFALKIGAMEEMGFATSSIATPTLTAPTQRNVTGISQLNLKEAKHMSEAYSHIKQDENNWIHGHVDGAGIEGAGGG